jgi:membrane fusion protein, multidrug efflux system
MTQMQHQVLTIPASALQRGPEGTFTYVVQSDSTIRVAPLTTGEQTGNIVVVEKGLEAGDKVVASNQYRLQPGSLIRANGPKVAKSGNGDGTEPAP